MVITTVLVQVQFAAEEKPIGHLVDRLFHFQEQELDLKRMSAHR